MTEIFIQLRDSIVVIEAMQGPEFVVDVLKRDGYDAKIVLENTVLVKEHVDKNKNNGEKEQKNAQEAGHPTIT